MELFIGNCLCLGSFRVVVDIVILHWWSVLFVQFNKTKHSDPFTSWFSDITVVSILTLHSELHSVTVTLEELNLTLFPSVFGPTQN